MTQPLNKLDASMVLGVFFDIDDTLSTEGKITSQAYEALWALKRAEKAVVPITGRAAGWCDHIARMWPVDAVIGENGAFYFMFQKGKLVKKYAADPAARAEFKKKLEAVRQEILQTVPGAGIASDQDYREFDLAIDYCEDVKPLSRQEVDAIVKIFQRHGAKTKISSIHVNGWFGDYDKLTAAKKFVQEELGLDLEKENGKFVFCGDSPNDEPMFAFFEKSVGVLNVLKFADRLKSFPKYVASKPAGEGFTQLVQYLLNH